MTTFLQSITKRRKSPEQIVGCAKTAMQAILDNENNTEARASACQSLEKRLGQMKVMLYGESDASAEVDESKIIELSKSLQEENLPYFLLQHMTSIPFEGKKDTALIINSLVRRNAHNFVSYVLEHIEIVDILISGYSNADLALNCGLILRELSRHDIILREIIHRDSIFVFFDTYVHLPNFDVASDAFSTLKDLLVPNRNKQIISQFLQEKYEVVFGKYELLLKSENYVTRRRSLKMLGEILLERSNYNIMIRYISSKDNLKTIMNALRDKSPNIQFEAFHIFKVFVANPNKPNDIATILFMNKAKLINFLSSFQNERDDAQFLDEKKLLIETLSSLNDPTAAASTSSVAKEEQP